MLHIYNICNPVIRIAIYLVVENVIFVDFNGSDVMELTEVTSNQESVLK